MNEEDDEKIGYGRPLKKHWFKKGVSGNPAGRLRKVAPVNDLKSMLDRVGKDEVGAAGKAPIMQAEAITSGMHRLAQKELRLRILAADIGHHP